MNKEMIEKVLMKFISGYVHELEDDVEMDDLQVARDLITYLENSIKEEYAI